MMDRLWSVLKKVIITCLIFTLAINCSTPLTSSDYFSSNTSTNAAKGFESSTTKEDVERLLYEDIYMINADRSCRAGNLYACLETGAGSVLLDLMNKVRFNHRPTITKRTSDENPDDENAVQLVKTSSAFNEEKVSTTSGRNQKGFGGFLGFLFRSADRFLRTTGLVIDLNDEITEGGLYQPRFIDEIYTEIDTLEDKNAKPVKQSQFKKLIIPLLVILKIFKLKLLVFLPILLGLASFKKIIALLLIIVPGIIGYLKVCKPDLGHSYGSYGHSSFYNVPPSLKRKKYQEYMQENPSMFYNNEEYAHHLAYQSSRRS